MKLHPEEKELTIYFLYYFKERIIFLGTPVDDFVSNTIVAQLLYLSREDPEKDINLYINSLVLFMQVCLYMTPCKMILMMAFSVGLSASMGTILLTAGAKENDMLCQTQP